MPMVYEEAQHGNLSWIYAEEPGREKLQELARRYGFHDLDIEDCLSETERPKIDEYKDYLFVVLHVPVYNAKKDRFETEEINIFIGDTFFITISEGKLQLLRHFFHLAKSDADFKKQNMEQGSGFLLYHFISSLFDSCFPLVDKVAAKSRRIERDLFEGKVVQDLLYDIMGMKRQLITLRRIIHPHRSIVMTLEHKHKRFLSEKLEVYFDDVVDKIEKLWMSLEALKDIADTLQEANEALVSHNTNNVIKILTVFSVIMLPLTFITGLYGMNVGLPGAERAYAFGGIVLMMLLVIAVMLAFFRWRKWI